MKKTLIVLSLLFILAVPMASATLLDDFFEKFFAEDVTGMSFVSSLWGSSSSKISTTKDVTSDTKTTSTTKTVVKDTVVTDVSKEVSIEKEEPTTVDVAIDKGDSTTDAALTVAQEKPVGGQFVKKVLKKGAATSLKGGKVTARIDKTFMKNGKKMTKVKLAFQSAKVAGGRVDINGDGMDDYEVASINTNKIILRKIKTDTSQVKIIAAGMQQKATTEGATPAKSLDVAGVSSQAADTGAQVTAVSKAVKSIAGLFGRR